MKNLSEGSIPGHVAAMSMQMFVGMVVQVAYFVTDLKFVTILGNDIAAGFSAAGNLWFAVLALTQILNVGTAALVSHAVGAKQHERANLVFNQSLMMSVFMGAFVLVALYAVARPYMHLEAADAVVAQAGIDYLMGVTPGLALQFVTISLFATLRGTGIVKPTMIIQFITVGLNILFAAILTIGWLTGKPYGAFGAGLATTLATVAGVIISAYYFHRHEKYVSFHREQTRPNGEVWKRLILIGLPIGLEFFFMSFVMGVMYFVIRQFGADAQAGLAEGQGAMRFIMLPAMAVAFAAAPIAGQNFGARKPERVRETFRWTVGVSIVIMLALTVFCQFGSHLLMHIFTHEEAVVAIGATMLTILSWNFAANGIIFSCSSMFQGLGNTWPTIASSVIRLFIFVVPVLWLSTLPSFRLEDVWYLSVGSMFLQAVVALILVRREFAKKLMGTVPVSWQKGTVIGGGAGGQRRDCLSRARDNHVAAHPQRR
ncbi:MAG TPA: MATE family efflux transporter, partial [Steroidobacteraceae bacterium]|nr:MATE family efflux transporter [Steroidobacteraceae bacterium]